MKHAEAIRDLEGMLKANDVRSKHDLSQTKLAAEKVESDLRASHEKALKERDDTIQALERELTALKGDYYPLWPIRIITPLIVPPYYTPLIVPP